tara:strand:+ start:333 stop:1172 length:840 start_codon:yes stop_codon:yes gene_type:complete
VTILEDIILEHDKRGIAPLRQSIPSDYLNRSAEIVLSNVGKVFITTGFYILTAGTIETDGPPGAIALGNGLEKLGYEVVYITDSYASKFLDEYRSHKSRLIDFPICSDEESCKYSKTLLGEEKPAILISIERCGRSHDGLYRNMRNLSITEYTAQIDRLFDLHNTTIGIGDGGNEIGMGNVFKAVEKSSQLVENPTITKVSELIISSVSNWVGYGLLAQLSQATGINLLPNIVDEKEMIEGMVNLGAVDGVTGKSVYQVDGFELNQNAIILDNLAKELG